MVITQEKSLSTPEGEDTDFPDLYDVMIPGSKGHAFHACMKEHDLLTRKIPFAPIHISLRGSESGPFLSLFLHPHTETFLRRGPRSDLLVLAYTHSS